MLARTAGQGVVHTKAVGETLTVSADNATVPQVEELHARTRTTDPDGNQVGFVHRTAIG